MGVERGHRRQDDLRSEVDNLRTALAGRDLIGQAKGILMERHGITADEAFERLVQISQTTNTKLGEVAALLVGSDGRAGDDRSADGQGGRRRRTGVD
ncbi:ANTAR domain-containing protein [Iamia sp. SCSIO 61187]|uniref:ANTAR domain-containing response regulator n=1 Tax=Iamia sp. SCSIO 61187 TaxID=2722752 RepID=UPI001C626B54|nr:ANTAR domain-containing protein [Iamia sp. SCSIO 61187]QYG92283.1 ANTAR domain-containing protein [Iamia sp. SCSIO 61187]